MPLPGSYLGPIRTVDEALRAGAHWRELYRQTNEGGRGDIANTLNRAFGPRNQLTPQQMAVIQGRVERGLARGEDLLNFGRVQRSLIPRNSSIPEAYQYHVRIQIGERTEDARFLEFVINAGNNLTAGQLRDRVAEAYNEAILRGQEETRLFHLKELADDAIWDIQSVLVMRRT